MVCWLWFLFILLLLLLLLGFILCSTQFWGFYLFYLCIIINIIINIYFGSDFAKTSK